MQTSSVGALDRKQRRQEGAFTDAMVFMVRNKKTQQRGITLLELLVVAALASILLAVVFPSVRSGLGTLELRSSARRLAAAAKYARDQAIYRQSFFQLEIDTESGTISVMDMDATTETNATGQSGSVIRRSFELPATVRIGKILPDEEDAPSRIRRFLFSPDGGSDPFQVVLENPRRKVQVSTDPLTGFPKVDDL